MVHAYWNQHGYWRIRVKLPTGKEKTFTSRIKGPKGKRAVEVAYKEWKTQQEAGLPDRISVTQAVDLFLQDKRARVGKNSLAVRDYYGHLSNYILPYLGNRPVSDVKLYEYQHVLNHAHTRKGEPLHKKTMSNVVSTVNAFIRFCYNNYLIDELPRGQLYIPAGLAGRERIALTPIELAAVLSPSPLHYHPLICLIALTGMRPGEGLGLQWSDYNPEKKTIHINRSLNSADQINEDGKTANALRTIPLSDAAVEIIKNQKGKDPTWIFPGEKVSKPRHHALCAQYRALCKERNIPGVLYDLRHTFISNHKYDMPTPLLKQIVGHSDNMPTFDIYGHETEADIEEARRILNMQAS